jgi:hypothetical protein
MANPFALETRLAPVPLMKKKAGVSVKPTADDAAA